MSPIGVYMRVELPLSMREPMYIPNKAAATREKPRLRTTPAARRNPPFDLFSMYAPTVMSGNTIGNSLSLSSIIFPDVRRNKEGPLYETRITVRSEILQ